MMTYDVELVELESQPAGVVAGHVTVTELPAFLGTAFADVLRALSEQHLAPAGPPFGRFTPSGGGFDVEAGFPADGTVAPTGRVVPVDLPGGPAARVLHQGDYGAIAPAYDAVDKWLGERGYVHNGVPWETYLDGPDVPEPRTLVYVPFTSA